MLENETVLVVDDSSTARRITSDMLRRYLKCRKLFEAHDGSSALKVLEQYSAEIGWVFCDWEMPPPTGDELLHKIRATPEWEQLRFVMVTSRADRESLLAAVEAGVDAYIVKPFTTKTVIAAIQRVMQRAERRRADRLQPLEKIAVTVEPEGGGDGGGFTGRLVDISATGARIRTESSMGRGLLWVYDNVGVRIESPQGEEGGREGKTQVQELRLPCEVVRIEAERSQRRGGAGKRDTVDIAVHFAETLDSALQGQLYALIQRFVQQSTVPNE
ncbi:response regulator [Halorhodospira abdelmalekii]|uniref:response regulator n=1 Tax=Halorhodospira abdelmalekii TaxID=421629 RepID=UPI001905870F|nr:response regulator [Halorhodospira abdelmalekii]